MTILAILTVKHTLHNLSVFVHTFLQSRVVTSLLDSLDSAVLAVCLVSVNVFVFLSILAIFRELIYN